MERRELLKMIALLTGGAVIGGNVFLSGCKNAPGNTGVVFSKETIALLDEIGETILPKTTTPGAKDAAIGTFMQTIVADCYYPADQKIFLDGIAELKKRCEHEFNKDFLSCAAAQRSALIKKIDAEATAHSNKKMQYDAERNNQAKGTLAYKKDEMPGHWFSMMKQLTLWGFFTSEVGASQALRYIPVPGRYEGDVAYKKGDRALFPCY
jgi:hypothetical protein